MGACGASGARWRAGLWACGQCRDTSDHGQCLTPVPIDARSDRAGVRSEAGYRGQGVSKQREPLVEGLVVPGDGRDLFKRGPLAVQLIELLDCPPGCCDRIGPLVVSYRSDGLKLTVDRCEPGPGTPVASGSEAVPRCGGFRR